MDPTKPVLASYGVIGDELGVKEGTVENIVKKYIKAFNNKEE